MKGSALVSLALLWLSACGVDGPGAAGSGGATTSAGRGGTQGASGAGTAAMSGSSSGGSPSGSGGQYAGTGGHAVAAAGSSAAGGFAQGGRASGGGGNAASGAGTGGAGGDPSGAGRSGAGGDGGRGGRGGSGAGGSAGASAGRGGAAGAAGTGGAGAGAGGAAGTVDASTMAKAMRFGANIGNTLENTAAWETGWGQPLITQTFINGMASRGIKTVRVPVAWDTYAVNGVIDSSKLNRVKEVVAWIETAGMYPIVNIHWDGGWIDNENKSTQYQLTDDVKTKFASYWRQIATGFSEVGHQLVFEGLNEEGRFYVNGDVNGTPDMAALNTLNQLFVTTVRAQGGYNATRALLIAGFNTDINKTAVDAFAVPTDPAGSGKLFLSIHYYDPYTFTLMEDAASWGSPSATWGTDAEKKALDDQFTKLATFATKQKIPVILGEFAVTRGEKVVRQSASRIAWMSAVADAALSRGMVPVLWDTGSEISRSDGSFSSELQSVMKQLP
jgi:endoglucanase